MPSNIDAKEIIDHQQAGTSGSTPPDSAKFVENFAKFSKSPYQIQPISLPSPAQPLRTDAHKIKMRFMKRRTAAVKPYNKTPLPSITCLLPISSTFSCSPTYATSLDACATFTSLPYETADDMFDWTVYNYMDNISPTGSWIDLDWQAKTSSMGSKLPALNYQSYQQLQQGQ